MFEVSLFFILFGSLWIITILGSIGSYCISHIAWFTYSKNCQDIFNKEDDLNNFPLILKNHVCYSLLIYFIFHLLNVIDLIIFIYLWIVLNYNVLYFIPFIFGFLVCYIPFYFLIRLNLKEFKTLKIYPKNTANKNFKLYRKKVESKLKLSEFKLFKFDKIAARNFPFQLNQWRYRKKIRRLNNKKYNEEKYNIKLLNIYIRYLKTYAVFYKGMQNSLEDFIDDYSVEINNKYYDTLEPLKKALIINFFVYVDQK